MGKRNLKVSIIIPVYNAASTISISMDSLLQQTYTALELLFIDDGSKDQSVAMIKQRQKEATAKGMELRLIRHDYNRGVACARNSGLDHATGEYIYYVDADDFLESDAVQRLVETAEKTQADIVGCDWFLEFANNRRVMRQPRCKTAKAMLESVLVGSMRWNLWIFLVRRSLYETKLLRFIPGMNMGEDLMMMVKLLGDAHTVSFVEAPLYHYNQMNVQSLTKSYGEKQIDEVSANIRELENYLSTIQSVIANTDEMVTYLKLQIKLPMLIGSDTRQYIRWIHWFPEVNGLAWKNPVQPLRIRLLQWAALKRKFWICKLHYYFVVRFVYGVIYR